MRLNLVFMFLSFVQIVICQDTIYKKNNDNIAAKIIEIDTDDVKFKKWNNQDGPLYTELKSEIKSIKYANGMSDTFNNVTPTIITTETVAVTSSNSIQQAPRTSYWTSNSDLLLLIDAYPHGEIKNKLKQEYIKMLDYRNTQYLSTGLGYFIGFSVPVVFTYAAFSNSLYNNAVQTIVIGAVLGAAIRTTGAVIAKINKNKRLHKKEEIIAIFNNLK